VYTGCLYGVRMLSPWPLIGLTATTAATREIRIVDGATTCAHEFEEAANFLPVPGTEWWLHCADLPNGGVFIRWANQFEFIVAPRGDRINARMLVPSAREAFHACLLGVALSFALIKQGIEPLHATAVVVDGGAIAFVGESGEGKSVLAAAFIGAGHRLVTDDLLVVTPEGETLVVHPGPPRIKLFRELATLIPGPQTPSWRLATGHPKELIPLSGDCAVDAPVPLRAVYALDRPENGDVDVAIARLSGRDSALALIESTFNVRVTDAARLTHHLHHVTTLADAVPVSTLRYPRRLELLPEVVRTVLDDCAARRQ